MLRWSIVAALSIVTIGLYWPVSNHAFVEFDDPLYVTANANVLQGVTLENIGWAFLSSDAYIWHPLTWLSYMIDFDLHGTERAGPWLLTNVALHALNASLLFTALLALFRSSVDDDPPSGPASIGTDRVLACAGVAALFALHPIQVESVAWVSARKELLAGTFVLLTLHAYTFYVRRKSLRAFGLVVVTMSLCSMAKGSHVGLPFLLLLLDYWPLRRLDLDPGQARTRVVWGLLREKIPLLLVSLGSVAVNYVMLAQSYNVFVTDPPLLSRVGTILVNLVDALARWIWPTQLAIVYPTPLQITVPAWPLYQITASLAALVLLCVLSLRLAPRHGYLLVGWLWFLGMLLPMTGLLPMGIRTLHDRYLYVPMIGLAIALCFGARELASRSPRRRWVAPVAVSCAIACYASVSRQQVRVWQDSTTLFDHALAVTERNAVVHYSKGTMLARRGEHAEALRQLATALSIHPDYADANNNLGYLLARAGQTEPSIVYLKRAVAVRPDWERAVANLVNAQLQHGDLEGALQTLRVAVELIPESPQLRDLLARAERRAEHEVPAE